MSRGASTCWTVIRGAAAGEAGGRESFARRYEPVVRAYLGARWRRSPLAAEVDDAAQDVFIACFDDGGVLERADDGRPFRPFFYGVVRNVARQHEARHAAERQRRAPSGFDVAEVARDEQGLASVFDRAWLLSLLRQAVERHRKLAAADGETGRRRVELLRLRFEEGLPVREIARRWEDDPARVHKEYARARDDFKAVLLDVVAFHHPGATPGEVGRECARLLALLR